MDKMDHNAHSVYLMYYHLIMVVKYRRKVIDDTISERAKIWEHVHLIMESHWKNGIMMLIMCMLCFRHSQNQNSVNLSMRIKVQAVVLLKGISTDQERLLEEAFWSQVFCLLTAEWLHRLMLSVVINRDAGEKR